MSKKTKKVVLFIVEGVSDEYALQPILKHFFQSDDVRFHVVHGDLTSVKTTSASTIVNRICECIKNFMGQYHLQKTDFFKVIQLIDTDGAFIPEHKVIPSDSDVVTYCEDVITDSRRRYIPERNRRKAEVVRRLVGQKTVYSIPFAIYYFSRNLEHVMFNESRDLSDDEKKDYSMRCADTYEGVHIEFMNFLQTFLPHMGYRESWDFIMKDTNSLHRHCNLHILLSETFET